MQKRMEALGQAKIHSSEEEPLCPLCGVDLGIPAVPQMPCTTLTRLGRHFSDDCTKTRQSVGPSP